MKNFKYFAMMYLNDWYESDKPLMDGIASESERESRNAFQRAANYYRVTRNFHILDGEKRLETALALVLKVPNQITDENVCQHVTALANEFREIYGTFAVSAASKFLWLRFRSPVVIFDSRAKGWLKANNYMVEVARDYSEYRKQWLVAFSDHEREIREACTDLAAVKEYSHAFREVEKDVSEISQSQWFRERVFDKYLWYNAGRVTTETLHDDSHESLLPRNPGPPRSRTR